MEHRSYRRAIAPVILATALILGTLGVGAASALPTQPVPAGATCTYAWGAVPGVTNGIYLSGNGSQGYACTTQVSVFCHSGYWNGWVTLYVPNGGNYGRNSNPCATGDAVDHVYFRELWPWGRLCWTDGPGHVWGWNRVDGLCNA